MSPCAAVSSNVCAIDFIPSVYPSGGLKTSGYCDLPNQRSEFIGRWMDVRPLVLRELKSAVALVGDRSLESIESQNVEAVRHAAFSDAAAGLESPLEHLFETVSNPQDTSVRPRRP